MRRQLNPACLLLLAEDVKKDFNEFNQSGSTADYIVIGYIGSTWSYAFLNQAFNTLKHGAKLMEIHKNKFWQTESGLQMDIGGFVDVLEYASGVKAMIIGEPSSDLFQVALDDMGLESTEVAIIRSNCNGRK